MAEQPSELLPCPFCGHVGLDFKEGSTFRWIVAECSGCGASRGETRIQTLGEGTKEEWMDDAKEDAIRDWNRRAALSQPSTAWTHEINQELERQYLKGFQAGKAFAVSEQGWKCPKCGIDRHGPLIACMQEGCPPPPIEPREEKL